MQRESVEYLVMILYALTVRWSSRFGDQLRYTYILISLELLARKKLYPLY
jgi:hypothetical protein